MKKGWIASTVLLWVLPLAFGADSKSPLPKEPKYASKRPLYFRVLLGKEGKASMLGVLDESEGTGTGYNVAYMDENMDNDLTNDAPKKFPMMRARTGTASTPDPRFDFKGPLNPKNTADYTLNIYSLRSGNPATPKGKVYFFWYLKTEGWNYFVINGQMTLYPKAGDALKGEPVRLGGPCKWDISSRVQNNVVLVSAGLKDENGSTLRTLSGPDGARSPQLTLLQDGKTVKEEKLRFG
jgi:hypothetical protein